MDNEFLERIDKDREYKAYITEHIAGVEDAYNRLILPLKFNYNKSVDQAVDLCGQLVPLHDLSKLSVIEFDAYRRFHYPTALDKKDKSVKEAFEKAKEHHYFVNPHHPIFWTKSDEKMDMPLHYIFEMLCDWDSVTKHLVNEHKEKTSVVKFYDEQAKKEKAAFTPHTRKLVDFWVEELFRKPGIDY